MTKRELRDIVYAVLDDDRNKSATATCNGRVKHNLGPDEDCLIRHKCIKYIAHNNKPIGTTPALHTHCPDFIRALDSKSDVINQSRLAARRRQQLPGSPWG